MKSINNEQIDVVINSVMINISKDIHKDFQDKLEEIPEEYKNNPYLYGELCASFAINKASMIISEVLKELLVD